MWFLDLDQYFGHDNVYRNEQFGSNVSMFPNFFPQMNTNSFQDAQRGDNIDFGTGPGVGFQDEQNSFDEHDAELAPSDGNGIDGHASKSTTTLRRQEVAAKIKEAERKVSQAKKVFDSRARTAREIQDLEPHMIDLVGERSWAEQVKKEKSTEGVRGSNMTKALKAAQREELEIDVYVQLSAYL